MNSHSLSCGEAYEAMLTCLVSFDCDGLIVEASEPLPCSDEQAEFGDVCPSGLFTWY